MSSSDGRNLWPPLLRDCGCRLASDQREKVHLECLYWHNRGTRTLDGHLLWQEKAGHWGKGPQKDTLNRFSLCPLAPTHLKCAIFFLHFASLSSCLRILSKAYKIWKKTQVIVKRFLSNSFLYLVAYFVDKKKTKQWLRTSKREAFEGCMCVWVCVCVCVCVCAWLTAFYLYRRMCDMSFSYGHGAYTNHTGTRIWFSLGGVREGCRCCSIKMFIFEKDKKAVAVIETFFS